ncbi:hypothetical protein [Halarcobacter sp.]|uniref:hypothetical protein n=1 Tax=Halarcobacter sp. TaxID=2321133 RepID=UPI003B001ED1
MFKNFFFTIFLSLIFVSFLEASNEKINQQLFELKTSQDYAQKINDEKITLIMGQIIQKENEIKELEKELKDYVNKDDLQREINYQNNRIEDINSHVDKLSISVTVVGILITVILLLFTGTFFYVSNKKHLEKVDEWINKNKDKILEPIHEEGKELLKNIENRALKFYQEQLKDLKLDEKLNASQRQTKLEILNKVNELLEHKNKEEYTFDDWNSKYINSFYNNDFENALIYINSALKTAIKNSDFAMGLFNKGLVLSLIGDLRKGIEVYNELINRFKDSKENSILVCVVAALVGKGKNLGMLNKNGEALEIYDEVVKRFEDSKDNSILEKVASALVNKIESNLILNKKNTQKDLDLYFELVKDKKDELIKYQMITLLEKAKDSEVDEEIISWKDNFKDTLIKNWSFYELKTWANSFDDEVIKERLLRYIDIFEKHNESIEKNQSNI